MEKLTEMVTVKFSAIGESEMKAVARSRGMEVSEYIRHLVSEDIKIAHQQWSALCEVFDGKARHTTCDLV